MFDVVEFARLSRLIRIQRGEESVEGDEALGLEGVTGEAEPRAGSARLKRNSLGGLQMYDPSFEKQYAAATDGAKRQVWRCGRRAGKTTGVLDTFIETGTTYPRSLLPYIALTRDSAKDIVWPVVEERMDQLDKLGITGFKLDDRQLQVKFPNGSKIKLYGADDWRKIQKLRGVKVRKAAIDEAGSFPDRIFRELVDNVLEPATMDYEGTIIVVGTPPPVLDGLFYDISQEDNTIGWSVHTWTCLDNPYLPHAQAWLDRLMSERGWDGSHPTYLREYMGRWVKDGAGLVYQTYKNAINMMVPDLPFPAHPDYPWAYTVVAVDLGASVVRPTTSYTILSQIKGDPKVYVRSSRRTTASSSSEIVSTARRLFNEYGAGEVVVDPGGLGKLVIGDMVERAGLPAIAAEKADKAGAIESLAAAFAQGLVVLADKATRDLQEELSRLMWNDRLTGIDERCLDHCADGMLYGWRRMTAWSYRPKTEDSRTEEEKLKDWAIGGYVPGTFGALAGAGSRAWAVRKSQQHQTRSVQNRIRLLLSGGGSSMLQSSEGPFPGRWI